MMKIDVGNIYLDAIAYRFAFMAHMDTTSKNNALLFIVAFSVYWLPRYMFFFEQADAISLTGYVNFTEMVYSTYRRSEFVAVVAVKNSQYTYAQLIRGLSYSSCD
jgi:hypothetical protein